MKLPKFITFTGVDAKTSIIGMIDLSDRYPIEWGILFGKGEGNRYMDGPKIREYATSGGGMRRSAHLCGGYSRAFQQNRLFRHAGVHDFDRIQVNFRPSWYNYGALRGLAEAIGRPIICQHRDQYMFPDQDPRLQFLYDRSGGRGVPPKRLPKWHESNGFVGYAGGIGPGNVIDVLKGITAEDFWIDMESGVRTDDWFDLDKVEDVCRQVYG